MQLNEKYIIIRVRQNKALVSAQSYKKNGIGKKHNINI